MGSSKKHKEKDKERSSNKDKKDKSSRRSGEEVSISKNKRSKHRSRSRSPRSPGGGGGESPPERSPQQQTRERKRKGKDKRRHGGEDSEDSDVPVSKSSRYEESQRQHNKPPSRSPSPNRQSGDGSVLSVDETNKLRIKLGLKPLTVEASFSRQPPPPPPQSSANKAGKNKELEDGEHEEEEDFDEETLRRIREEREKEGETFWKEKKEFVHAPAESLTAKRKADKLREKLTTMKEKRKIESKMLDAKGLGEDSDEEDLDAAKWVLKQKEIADQKALAAKRAKELDDLDNEFGVGEVVASEFLKRKNKAYSGNDLKGMKVLHDQTRIKEGEQVVVVLKDKGVLDEDDDTLINVNMVDDEKFEKNVENRKLRPELHGYNAYEEVDFDSAGNLKTKSMLGKYDEEISGPQQDTFVIGDNISEETRRARIREKMVRSDKILESAEGTSYRLASDFYTSDEMVSFKKPKKKVRKVRKVLRADDILKLDTEINPAPAGVINQQDLGSRRKASETVVKSEVQDMEIDLELDDFRPSTTDVDISDFKLEDEGDIDFQLALNKARKMKQKQSANKPNQQNVADLILQDIEREGQTAERDAGSSIVLHATAEFCRTLGDIPSLASDNVYGDEEMDFEQEEKHKALDEDRGAWNEVDIDETPVDITRIPEEEQEPILEQEPDVGIGLAGALKLAEKKGYLEQEKIKRMGAAKLTKLQAQHYHIEDKNYEDERVQGHKHHFYSGPQTEFREKDGYKPEIKLQYNDEDGKAISAKEAFRLLSHKFHGKGSGKNKIDKKRKKGEQEKLLQHMNSTDTPLGTLELLQQKQKETHSAYLILSGSKAQHSLSKSKR